MQRHWTIGFTLASEGMFAIKKIDHDEDYSLLECIATLHGQPLPTMNAGQSNVLGFGLKEEKIGRSGIAQEEDYSLLVCTTPLQG